MSDLRLKTETCNTIELSTGICHAVPAGWPLWWLLSTCGLPRTQPKLTGALKRVKKVYRILYLLLAILTLTDTLLEITTICRQMNEIFVDLVL